MARSAAAAEISPEREERRARPWLKWVGGKRQLLPELRKHLPLKIKHYYEPFLGGGALFFDLRAADWEGAATLGDTNGLLIQAYRGVRDDVEAVIEELRNWPYAEKFYYEMRARDIASDPDDAEVAAWFIYMNKTGFNGLWRVNKQGRCNVPFGKYTNPTICDADGLRVAAEALKKTKLVDTSFEKTLRSAEAGDLVYCDPPYVPVNTTSNFTSYTCDGFTLEDQRRLVRCALGLKERGVHVMLSNADVPTVHELYADKRFVLHRVKARRNINSKGGSRGAVGELIIT